MQCTAVNYCTPTTLTVAATLRLLLTVKNDTTPTNERNEGADCYADTKEDRVMKDKWHNEDMTHEVRLALLVQKLVLSRLVSSRVRV